MLLHCGHRRLDLSEPKIMGILNVTPDSFSDGGKYRQLEDALAQARQMVADGAAILDIGGESTRPGASDVALEEELERTIPVIEALRAELDVVLSIDTSKAEVMSAALDAGADLINDVRALQEPGAMEVAARSEAAICLMHMQGQPRTMQASPHYDDVITDISAFFQERLEACCHAGIEPSRLLLDPGFGFGKTLEHNYQLLANLSQLDSKGCPILAGLSRKSMIGNLLGRPMEQRVVGSVVGALLAAQQGAKILRVHDVAETSDALAVWQKTQSHS